MADKNAASWHCVLVHWNVTSQELQKPDALFPSLTGYIGNPLLNIVIMLLIILGGLGFLTWEDVYSNRLHFNGRRARLRNRNVIY